MRELSVFMEINGSNEYVGRIVGTDSADTCFIYADAYLAKPEQCAISIGLPLQEKQFNAKRTRIFFEGFGHRYFARCLEGSCPSLCIRKPNLQIGTPSTSMVKSSLYLK